ncbi:MAG: histidine kinase [Verrucomicrobiota bacterium]|jgi:signal transduction histidine kinase|nr:histidine kinase [Verrucomicrobiota bacterium]
MAGWHNVDNVKAKAKEYVFRTARWQILPAVVLLFLGLGITAWMVIHQYHQGTRRVEQAFQQASEKMFERTVREIQLFMEVLDSIRQLHTLSDQVTPDAFDEIVRKGMVYQRRILGAYGFVQYIPHEFRMAYESKAEGPGRSLVMSDRHGGYVPVPTRPGYFPLTYQTPPGGLGVPEGYDFGVPPENQTAIASMMRWGVFALGARVEGAPADRPEYPMFAPIFVEQPPRGRELAGFAVGLFLPRRIVDAAMEDSLAGIQVRLEPISRPLREEAPGRWHYERELSLANQEWCFLAWAEADYAAAIRSRAPFWVGGFGLLASVALAGLFAWVAGRAKRIERLVQRRTAELARANAKLSSVMAERRELEDEILRITGSEKARIGRDLHDSLGQKLTGAMYLFGAYRQKAVAPDPTAEAEAVQIAGTLKDAVTQIRRIARGLAPVALTEAGLPDALRQLAAESSALFQTDVEFYAEQEGRPRDAATAEHLYLIAQESVNNAIQHGRGTHVVLTLGYDAHGGVLGIEDNGRGMAAALGADGVGGSGLRIMKHRAEVFGGDLQVDNAPGGGTRIICRFPAA